VDYQSEIIQFGDYLERRVRPGTARVYTHALKLWFAELTNGQPTREEAQAYVDNLMTQGKSASTVSLRAHAIMRWFKWKGEKIELDRPPIKIGEPNYLTVSQVEELITFCKTVLEKTLVVVLFDTALRISELLNIELDDIDWTNGFLTVTGKGGDRQSVNISDKASAALSEWIDVRASNDKKVFMDIDYNYAWTVVRNLGKRANMKIHPHIFRHSRAIQMLMSGAEIYIVRDHLRHKDVATTINIYGRFMVVHLKDKVPAW